MVHLNHESPPPRTLQQFIEQYAVVEAEEEEEEIWSVRLQVPPTQQYVP